MERMSDADLLILLNDIESDKTERKQSLSDDKKVRQAICAFANDLPRHNERGVIFIGACDDGTPSNEPITDKLLLTLADMKTDGKILPLPVMTVEKRFLKGAYMAVVTVMPSDMPPVKYDGRIWIRVGPSRRLASEQDERVLNEKRRYNNLPFDLRPYPPADVRDLSRSIFENDYLPQAIAPDVLEANNRTFEERLSSCKMIVSTQELTPTVFGLLSIGKIPRDFIQGAYIQFLRIDGTKLTDEVTDNEEIDGPILEMLRRADEKLKAHNRSAIDVTSSATHIITEPYPLAAIQQILYNAVLHRTYEGTNAPVRLYWYNDKIEIHSPGGPYGSVNISNFGKGETDYRNPNLATVMKTFGYVQRFGRGIDIAREALKRNGNPPLEFDVKDNAVLSVIRKKP